MTKHKNRKLSRKHWLPWMKHKTRKLGRKDYKTRKLYRKDCPPQMEIRYGLFSFFLEFLPL
jgi:hypothetical protein